MLLQEKDVADESSGEVFANAPFCADYRQLIRAPLMTQTLQQGQQQLYSSGNRNPLVSQLSDLN